MVKKLRDSDIPKDVSSELMKKSLTLAFCNVEKVLRVLMVGASKFLATIKSKAAPMGIAFRREDGSFIAGGKIAFIKNPDDPDDPSTSNWSYTWTFNEDDMKDCKTVVDVTSNKLIHTAFASVASNLYRMRFESESTAVSTFNTILDAIYHWLGDNAKEDDECVLECDSCTATSRVKDGVVVRELIPSSEMKVIIKEDDQYQDSVL